MIYFVGLILWGMVNLDVFICIECYGLFFDGFCFKSWEEFVGLDVFNMDFIVIVCDSVVGEVCFVWLGYLFVVYWGIFDLVGVEGDDVIWVVVFDFVYECMYCWILVMLVFGDDVFSVVDVKLCFVVIGVMVDL